jgi:hypothetical protein
MLIGVSVASQGYARTPEAFGGVSGGGGNVIDPTPPDVLPDSETVEHLVKRSYRHVRFYLENKEQQFQNGQLDPNEHGLFAKVFEGRTNIITALDLVKPDVEDSKPCYDYEQQPVDASIATDSKNKFCVSSYSLRQKVIRSEIPRQSTALMIHEYSEIVGTSEEDAVAIQKVVLEDLKSLDF